MSYGSTFFHWDAREQIIITIYGKKYFIRFFGNVACVSK